MSYTREVVGVVLEALSTSEGGAEADHCLGLQGLRGQEGVGQESINLVNDEDSPLELFFSQFLNVCVLQQEDPVALLYLAEEFGGLKVFRELVDYPLVRSTNQNLDEGILRCHVLGDHYLDGRLPSAARNLGQQD